jgi:hypothetical protein
MGAVIIANPEAIHFEEKRRKSVEVVALGTSSRSRCT